MSGDWVEALADYNKAIEIKPDDADFYKNRGVVKQDQGDFAGALADYNMVLKLNPNDADAQKHVDELKERMAK